ncbi:MAG: hypothetical protein R2795_13790 [Saprospiraceae bacterium]
MNTADGTASLHSFSNRNNNQSGNDAKIPFIDNEGHIWIGLQKGLGFLDDAGQIQK